MNGVSTSPGVPQPLATTDTPTFAGVNITRTSEETLTADFVTSEASATAVEYIFTPVPVTSGKTYRFEGSLWLKWGTGLVSGTADLYEISAEGPLTVDTNNASFAVINAGTYSSGVFGNTMASITETTGWVKVSFSGFFKATNSNNFNIGLSIPGWDSGDVVTIAKGATLRVQQVD